MCVHVVSPECVSVLSLGAVGFEVVKIGLSSEALPGVVVCVVVGFNCIAEVSKAFRSSRCELSVLVVSLCDSATGHSPSGWMLPVSGVPSPGVALPLR